ncbi:transglycosylase SLT domain-containing protein [Oscillibacter ruminantium]|uniref:transglycosylase SLT domain-containing protein n=1 Tax=Oscillibacter ruminantium TaxID=1263547 RepID=UPI00332CD5B2
MRTRRRRWNRTPIVGMARLLLFLTVVLIAATIDTAPEEHTRQQGTKADYIVAAITAAEVQEQTAAAEQVAKEPEENTQIETALLNQGYLNAAVPLDYTAQDIMRTACKEYGVSYSLALGVADVESDFSLTAINAASDCRGLMQLNPGPDNSYFAELQAATGVDPSSEYGNIWCGVYRLAEYLARYDGDTEKALMAYNCGPTGAKKLWDAGIYSTEYSRSVTEAAAHWAEIVQ